MQAARPDSGHGRGGGGSQLHGAGADSGHAESAEAGRPDDRSDRPGGAERGVRGAGARLHPRAQTRPGEGQHLRRRDRSRPPARRHRCEDFDDSRPCLTPYEVPLRFMRHVHRGRSRHLHGRGARLMAAYDGVLVEIAGGVGTLTLNRPEKLNAFDRALCDELTDALRMLAQSDGVRAMVITGAGRAFCAGADLAVLEADGPALVAAGKEVALAIRGAPQPVLAVVNGPAAGGGANLALACDHRIASDQASIGQVFHKLGLVPDWGGSFFLPRLVGTSKALELVWSARMGSAAEARDLGLFDRVVPHARLVSEAGALAEAWAGQPPSAVRRAKAALYGSDTAALAAMLDLEITHQNELFATPDVRARIAGGASIAKRSG